MILDEVFFNAVTRPNTSFDPVLEAGITVDDFEGEWKKIFTYVLDIYNNPKHKNRLPTARALEAKFKFYDSSVAEESVEYLCEKLLERRKANKLTSVLSSINQHLKPDHYDLESAINSYMAGAVEVADVTNAQASFVDLTKTTQDRYDQYLERKKGKNIYGIPCGIAPIDRRTLGSRGGEVRYVLGKTGAGKSWLLLKEAITAHTGAGPLFRSDPQRVLLIPLEMSKDEMAMRHDAMRFGISYSRLRKGKLRLEEEKRYQKGLRDYAADDSFIIAGDEIFEGGKITPLTLKAVIRKFKIGWVGVDGVYMMHSDNPRLHGWERHVDVGLGLKRIARSEQIPVAITNQLNNEATAEEATIENQRYGDYGQSCDVAIKLHQGTDERLNQKMLIWFLKLRNSGYPRSAIEVNWNFDTTDLGSGDFDPETEEDEQEQVAEVSY